jgi:hypothetical protein
MYVERPEIDRLFEGFESATGTSQSASGLALSYPKQFWQRWSCTFTLLKGFL